MPEEVETRVARLEEKSAAHEQRLNANDHRIETLTPLLSQVAILNERQQATHKGVENLREEFAEYRDEQSKRASDEKNNRTQFNRWAIGLAVAVLCALLSFAAILLVGSP